MTNHSDGKDVSSGGVRFILDSNLGLNVNREPWKSFLAENCISAETSSDLTMIDAKIAAHEPDLAFIPAADYHRLTSKRDWYYKGVAIGVSKYTGQPSLDAVLVVKKNDPAESLDDLERAYYGYINKSCSSSYFAPAILLNASGRRFDFLDIRPVSPWQGQIDAVLSGLVRATMVPEDVWKTKPQNAEGTKIVGRLADTKPPVVVACQDFDPALKSKLLEALVEWMPEWSAVYGGFKPYYVADMEHWFHLLDQLPDGL
jgi:ABC-type phosphate/phosphonate transport system substrate-binding protein